MPRVVSSNDTATPSAPISSAAKPVRDLSRFNFEAAAELFPSRGKHGRTQVRYRRFVNAAEAIRFAVEDISPAAMLGAYLEVNETRFGHQEIQALYAHPAFPLKRKPVKQAKAG